MSLTGAFVTGVSVTGVSITGVSICKNHKKVVDKTAEGEDAKYCPRSPSLEEVLSFSHCRAQLCSVLATAVPGLDLVLLCLQSLRRAGQDDSSNEPIQNQPHLCGLFSECDIGRTL